VEQDGLGDQKTAQVLKWTPHVFLSQESSYAGQNVMIARESPSTLPIALHCRFDADDSKRRECDGSARAQTHFRIMYYLMTMPKCLCDVHDMRKNCNTMHISDQGGPMGISSRSKFQTHRSIRAPG
jgi:hypothetical protein